MTFFTMDISWKGQMITLEYNYIYIMILNIINDNFGLVKS